MQRETDTGLTVVELDLPGQVTDYGEWWFNRYRPMMGGVANGFSIYWAKQVLDGMFGDPAVTSPTAPTYLALCSIATTADMTGATITEIAYTTYARKDVPAASMSAASGTTNGTKTNTSAITFAACTAGSATAIAWALLDVVTAGSGNMLAFGSCASTAISTTQTPPTVGVGALVVNCNFTA